MITISRVVTILLVAGVVLSGALTLTPSVDAAPDPPPIGCPDGWERVDPDLNPLLRCQPNTIAPNGNQGEPFASHYRYIDIYVRHDGEWKIVSVQITRIPEAPRDPGQE